MNKVERLRTLYQLEELILSDGDVSEIERLRKKLGIFIGDGHGYKGFCPEKYKNMKTSGMLDIDIRKEFNMSQSGLYKNKIKFGLI